MVCGAMRKTARMLAAMAVLAVALLICAFCAQPACAQTLVSEVDGSYRIESGRISVMEVDAAGVVSGEFASFGLWVDPGDVAGELSIVSSDASVATVDGHWASVPVAPNGYGVGAYVNIEVAGAGTCTFTISYLNDTVTFPFVCCPGNAKVVSVEKGAYDSVRLTWKTVGGVTGYEVVRCEGNWYGQGATAPETVATVVGAQATSALVKAPWGKEFSYCVRPYVSYGGTVYRGELATDDAVAFELPAASVELTAARQKPKAIALSWTADAGASGYEVYRSAHENRGFSKIASVSGRTYTDKAVKAGTRYSYKVRAAYPSRGVAESNSYTQIVPKKSAFASKAVKGVSATGLGGGAYGWAWSSSDTVFYYTQGSKLYMVCYTGKKLKVYGLDKKLKKVSAKTVKLPTHGEWGGFYHGPDGNNYVAVGYSNFKESKTKTVIKVVKYSKSWKKGKTAAIKGSASNVFKGIYCPFDAGVASFDMLGSTLYLFTCREMFALSDGLHHQSNIAFKIDTKTMKAEEDNIAYTSHSFNQRVRFKDGAIFLADHGDAYDRAICLTAGAGYGSSGFETPQRGTSAGKDSFSTTTFDFMGQTGQNSTGATMGGMEVGARNVLVCGTAQPHSYKVKGVTGFKEYNMNVFVTVTDRTTHKSKVKWLTGIDPKKGKQTVEECRMVKLSDDRFAVLYTVTNTKTGKGTLHCDVINGNGKKVSGKVYKKAVFTASSQPVLFDGFICWADYVPGKGSGKEKLTVYEVPAML